MLKYTIHPGIVYSQNDNGRHYISVDELIRLYHVKRSECIIIMGARKFFELEKDLIHLYPKNDGDYTLPIK